ncbi:MAG: CoA-binding protein [Pirellulaceae bacterium]|nr:CoA-binding protein [Pirellulaceae bacterium]
MPQDLIEQFLAGSPHAVAGASRDRDKYGNKVLRAYQQRQRLVYPINPAATDIEGLQAYADLSRAPLPLHGVSIVTPPEVTEQIVEQAARLGIRYLWMQPGAESDRAIQSARRHGIHVIAGGPCILVSLGFREEPMKRHTDF